MPITNRLRFLTHCAISLAAILAAGTSAPAAELSIALPLNRTVYQTNEQIDVSVLRTDAQALAASPLTLTLSSPEAGKATFTFDAPAAEAGGVKGADARATSHLHLDGRLLRPGKYTLEVTANDAAAKTEIEICTHVRSSSFKLFEWGGGGTAREQAAMGSLGFNMLYYNALTPDSAIRGGLDVMRNCTMGGGHQMDLRLECDWSDPYVLLGGDVRSTRQAFEDRTRPNATGVHFYDEPGLTWQKHPITGEQVPFNIPWQDRSYKAAFGQDALQYNDVKPSDENAAQRWIKDGRFKEQYMEAAWKITGYNVATSVPGFMPVTQTVYGWSAFGDGYYFNIARQLPVISGHGGYDDFWLYTYNPSLFFVMGRARDLDKPNWYLPCWYRSTPAERFRGEQYLSFMLNLQGMATPPDLTAHKPGSLPQTEQGIVESNLLMARLGTIFETMKVARPQVAVLYSLSDALHAQAQVMLIKRGEENNQYTPSKQHVQLAALFMAMNEVHMPFFPIVEEDVLDGTLAANHKVLVLTGLHYLDPKIKGVLEDFIAQGGQILMSDDATVEIKGAQKFGAVLGQDADQRTAKFAESLKQQADELSKDKIRAELARFDTNGQLIKDNAAAAKALAGKLQAAGIKPDLECDNPEVSVSRQGSGDIDYFFAVNTAWDEAVGWRYAMKPVTAKVTFDGERPTYDAVVGGAVALQNNAGSFRFGPGQMRVFARTARPIGAVQVYAPNLYRDFTNVTDPIHVELTATLLDKANGVLAGNAPMRVQLIDPTGASRYDLFRATANGVLRMNLQLGATDPAGDYKVIVTELLDNHEATASFHYAPAAQCGAAAGETHRAVLFQQDRDNIFRFFRTFRSATIVTGSGAYDEPAAKRLVEILKPWNVTCEIVKAADVKPREVPEEALKTWAGDFPGRPDPAKPSPVISGWDLNGAVILLGTPADNQVIKFITDNHWLPYMPVADVFPGRGRGYLAWQRDGVGREQESVSLIADDEAGMNEAVGSLYEIAVGMDPLMRLNPPKTSTIERGKEMVPAPAALPAAATTQLPDRVVALIPTAQGAIALSADGTLTSTNPAWSKVVPGGETWKVDTSDDGKVIAIGSAQHLTAFDQTGKQLVDVKSTDDEHAPVITAVAVSADGSKIAAACNNGKVTLVTSDGKRQWTVGGVTAEETAKYDQAVKDWEKVLSTWDQAAHDEQFAKDNAAYEAAMKEFPDIKKKDPKAEAPKKPNKGAYNKPGKPRAPLSDMFVTLTFSADGSTIIATPAANSYNATANTYRTIAAASGEMGKPTGGVSGYIQPVRAGANLLLGDGRGTVFTYSPAESKVTGHLTWVPPVPPAPVAKDPKAKPAPAPKVIDPAITVIVPLPDGGALLGDEEYNIVRRVKSLNGKSDEQTAWEHELPGHIVKKIVPSANNGPIAVAYWGGLLEMLDQNGKVIFSQLMPQDITGLAFSDGLFVGLANGQVLKLGMASHEAAK